MAEGAEKTVTVPLDEPVVRGDQKISSVELQRPMGAALLGLSMRDIMDLDAGTMHRLLPRITIPQLTTPEVMGLDPADLFALSVEASGFLLPRSVRPGLPEQ